MSKQKRKGYLQLFVWEEVMMSLAGHRQWSPKLRAYTRKKVFKPVERMDAHVSRISTKRKIMRFCEDFFGKGVWIVRGFSGGKTSRRVKQVRLAKVTVREHGDGFVSVIDDTWRCARYKWFWKDDETHSLFRTSSVASVIGLLTFPFWLFYLMSLFLPTALSLAITTFPP